MHEYKAYASPYLCEVIIDSTMAFTKTHLKQFQGAIERGVAVYGHSPDILLIAKKNYSHWETLGFLVAALDVGRVVICGINIPKDYRDYLRKHNSNVEVLLLGIDEVKVGRELLKA